MVVERIDKGFAFQRISDAVNNGRGRFQDVKRRVAQGLWSLVWHGECARCLRCCQ